MENLRYFNERIVNFLKNHFLLVMIDFAIITQVKNAYIIDKSVERTQKK